MLEARDRVGGRTYTVEADGKRIGLQLFQRVANWPQVFSTKWAGLGSHTTWHTCSQK